MGAVETSDHLSCTKPPIQSCLHLRWYIPFVFNKHRVTLPQFVFFLSNQTNETKPNVVLDRPPPKSDWRRANRTNDDESLGHESDAMDSDVLTDDGDDEWESENSNIDEGEGKGKTTRKWETGWSLNGARTMIQRTKNGTRATKNTNTLTFSQTMTTKNTQSMKTKSLQIDQASTNLPVQ
ncbi:hypothetical protein BCR33DRAFT_245086 [Rhizoclosmatium globosum]|uniref:Uncharacterized protein n=1 Tax=Rhizoclosmatium globosum TaxID=329046 RepID=A0A1Y2C9L1_9FUNG|nr:hypothetical protein BCR33DRAFT_245086 [Rhizoclosmatium globosum]|eukprot:ORY43626.1 hypothetical protein BCR33DRAFT_245086 [Rhizoclosmatium globosum]